MDPCFNRLPLARRLWREKRNRKGDEVLKRPVLELFGEIQGLAAAVIQWTILIVQPDNDLNLSLNKIKDGSQTAEPPIPYNNVSRLEAEIPEALSLTFIANLDLDHFKREQVYADMEPVVDPLGPRSLYAAAVYHQQADGPWKFLHDAALEHLFYEGLDPRQAILQPLPDRLFAHLYP
jgi:hypothetical protein